MGGGGVSEVIKQNTGNYPIMCLIMQFTTFVLKHPILKYKKISFYFNNVFEVLDGRWSLNFRSLSPDCFCQLLNCDCLERVLKGDLTFGYINAQWDKTKLKHLIVLVHNKVNLLLLSSYCCAINGHI